MIVVQNDSCGKEGPLSSNTRYANSSRRVPVLSCQKERHHTTIVVLRVERVTKLYVGLQLTTTLLLFSGLGLTMNKYISKHIPACTHSKTTLLASLEHTVNLPYLHLKITDMSYLCYHNFSHYMFGKMPLKVVKNSRALRKAKE